MRQIVLGLALLVMGNVAAAQTTYNSTSVSVNAGNLTTTFSFYGTPGDGDTELIIQCNLNRAQLILHFAQPDESVGEFAISCNPASGFPSPVFLLPVSGDTSVAYSGTVTMNYEFKAGSFPLALTVNKANWSFVCHYRAGCSASGSAQITY